MHRPARDNTTYSGNRADGDSTNIYGNVYGDVHLPGRPREAGEASSQQCLRDLRVTDPREDRARIEGDKDKLLRDCYAWVLDDASFQRWTTQEASRLLWIKGDPGKGKTMMTMGVIAELSQGDRARPPPRTMSKILAKLKLNSKQDSKGASVQRLVTYFFCQSTLPELNNAVSVLRGLIYMLITQREELMHPVQKRYEAVGKQLFEGPNAVYALRELLSDMLNNASLPPTYLLVDALDECTSGLSELLHIITDASLGRQSSVKWLVTSRNVAEIERYLQPDSLGVKVSLEVQASYVSRAVATFVTYKVQRLAIVQRYDTRLQAEVQQQLRDKAEGTFLWVSLVCKELEKVPLYRTQEVLQALPPGLDPLYDRMMGQVLGQDARTVGYCRSILRTITLVFRPLQLSELAATAGLPRDQFSDEQAVADLAGRCGSFLTVREGVVSFIHLSARDYFTLGSGKQIVDGTLVEDHRWLTERLLEAMSSTLRRDMCGLQKPGARIQEAISQVPNSSLPQIAYACEYWVKHIWAGRQDCKDLVADGGKVYSFFQKHLLHWLEAMSLLQKMPKAVLALQQLQRSLPVAGSTTVSKVVHDAMRFAMWSGSKIQHAPLQVYYSALVFAPKQSVVRHQFSQEMPKGVKVMSGLDTNWGPLLQTLEGHVGSVSSVAFSAVGDRLASASFDETMRVWDAQTGQLLQTLTCRTAWVHGVAFSPAGDRLASATSDTTVRVWDLKTGQPLHTLRGHTSGVISVAFSAVGDRLASASYDQTVRVWDAQTGEPLHTLKGHTDRVNSVAFAAQGDRLASASFDKTVRVWDVQTGQPLHTLRGHTSGVSSAAFSAAGDRLASASYDQTVRVWDVKTGETLHTLEGHTDDVNSVVFSAAGHRLASASGDRTVQVWDVQTGRRLHTLRGHTDRVRSVAFSAAGDRLASASDDWTVRVWDAQTEQPLQTLKEHADGVNSVSFSTAGDQLASASFDKTVRIWDTQTGQLLHTLEGHTGWVYNVSFSTAGDRLASASYDETVRVWDTRTGQLLQTLKGHMDRVYSVAFSAAGDRLASASYDETVRVWDAQTGQSLLTLQCLAWVYGVAFSAAGDRLASASSDWMVRVWDAQTGQLLHTLKGHTGWVRSVAFSEAGDRLASTSDDHTVRVWDSQTGQLLDTLKFHAGWVSSAAFSADGTYLETSLGSMPLPASVMSVSSLTPQPTHRILVSGRWLTVNSDGLLWIPINYFPSCTAVRCHMVAFGYTSGRVLLLGLT
ncbi:Pfs, NACHT and WD domain protein [Macroventuria anomochaeta]|uniref:Pfs, NACHT and WD domain protein n=1 Tax=Macroventuria anomochaeta TaxID=301207 RepID=A0ACB6RI38_9PLEO|nr:Pfs, NACHT and WD domain protein [Macroventuria anomochaeta]KAF2621070.1 Pfs, NACHT and WD domain protein [Macroventuria anomochaeta]